MPSALTGMPCGSWGTASPRLPGAEHSADASVQPSSPPAIMLSATDNGTLPVCLWFWPWVPGIQAEAGSGGHRAKTKATGGHD